MTVTLACIQDDKKWMEQELEKNRSEVKRLCRVEQELEKTKLDLKTAKKELEKTKLELKRLQNIAESKRTTKNTKSEIDLVRKIHGHKVKDKADPDIPVTNYSQLFKSTFDPLYDTLEGTPFNLNEDESSFLVNGMFQIIYTKCTKLMTSKITKQLQKLFVLQRELSDIEKERMTDTQYAYSLLLHAANIQEYQMSDDIDEIMNILCKNEVVKSVSEIMGTEMKALIKQSIEIIQSLLILVPPLVVDCFPNPDICGGAYGKNVVSCNAADYATMRSALFYSYKGELVAKYGECSSIDSITKLPVPIYLNFNKAGKLNSQTKLLEDVYTQKNATEEGKRLSGVDDKHEDEQENESTTIEISSGGVITETHRNTALSAIQSVDKYTVDKGTQTDDSETKKSIPAHMQITNKTISPVRKGKDNNEEKCLKNGKQKSATDIEKVKVRHSLFETPTVVGGESEHDKKYRTSLRKKSQAPELLPSKCKAFQHTNHEHQSTTHITTDRLYHKQSQSTTVDIHHEQPNPNAVGDTELVEVCSEQFDTKKDNSEEQSDTKKDNFEEPSDLKKDNSEEQSGLKKDNSEERSDLKKDNSEERSDLKKDNSEERSDLKKDNSKERSDLKKDNSEERSDLNKDNSKEQSDIKKDNSGCTVL